MGEPPPFGESSSSGPVPSSASALATSCASASPSAPPSSFGEPSPSSSNFVSAAFARRYGINRLVARIAALTIALVFTPLAYIGLWILMPSET